VPLPQHVFIVQQKYVVSDVRGGGGGGGGGGSAVESVDLAHEARLHLHVILQYQPVLRGLHSSNIQLNLSRF
jgi:hypothetical protein